MILGSGITDILNVVLPASVLHHRACLCPWSPRVLSPRCISRVISSFLRLADRASDDFCLFFSLIYLYTLPPDPLSLLLPLHYVVYIHLNILPLPI